MLFKPNPTSGVPIYIQLMEQVKHAIETGALKPGDQLPAIRKVAEDLVINPNTVAKVYRELEHEGVIELRQGAGAFVTDGGQAKMQTEKRRRAQQVIESAVSKLRALGLTEEEMRRWFEAELTKWREDLSASPENTKR
jgi:GntR family transcriptional regulator